MASTPKPRVKIPKTAKAGEVIVLKTLISHEMESGQRKDKDGNVIPRKIINKFTCEFNGQPVFSCDLDPAISANPYFEFSAKVSESGTFKLTWIDDDGSVYTDEQKIEVS
ncbi:thiosulfate oxidation carrier complex protein SoxZ [Mesorhizobium sp. 1B3]|uniref:thiosulfate oxidation carrier complex protein SoxZ n=1 Tax=Mesorhizobium sp. 1B3 TaxID=3243599 RepID=UPI003D9747E2